MKGGLQTTKVLSDDDISGSPHINQWEMYQTNTVILRTRFDEIEGLAVLCIQQYIRTGSIGQISQP